MSQLNIKKIKLGDNADTSKNFLISTPAVADGTLTIERENGTDVLTVDASGKVTVPFGVSDPRTWQDVKASRAFGVSYTNNTTREITVHVNMQNTNASAYLKITVGGVDIISPSISNTAYLTALTVPVPVGATYVATGTGTPTIYSWVELR